MEWSWNWIHAPWRDMPGQLQFLIIVAATVAESGAYKAVPHASEAVQFLVCAAAYIIVAVGAGILWRMTHSSPGRQIPARPRQHRRAA
jgi:hypothetical protein